MCLQILSSLLLKNSCLQPHLLGKLEKLEEKHSNIVEVKEGQTLVELQFGKDAVGDALISKVIKRF